MRVESLEDRTLLSDFAHSLAIPDYVLYHAPGQVSPLGTTGPMGYTPSQIRHAYGFDQITLASGAAGDGSGTTIAIVDAFDDPNVANDLQQFDAQFGLPNPSFTKVNESGGLLLPSPDHGWAEEIALDVEWAHAIAPEAKILLVETNDNTFANMFAGVLYAARQPGVVAVSMSWTGGEESSETSYDKDFLTPSGHTGVTFVGASGDNGAPPGYPAASPNVLATGGTTLNLDSQGNYSSEQGWRQSGGGISSVETQPAYQKGVVTQSTTYRTNPDVAYDADPNTGFPVYDSYNNGTVAPWSEFGGTSDAAPQWAALIAIADQGRILAGKTALDGASQTLPMLYQLPATDFHDITSGSSEGTPPYSTASGYDLVTGRGTPIANKIVTGLIGSAAATSFHFSVGAPATGTAGSPFTVTVTALDQNNNPLPSYTGTIHFTSSDSRATLPANYTFTAADKGVHTFTNGVTLTKAGSDQVTVTDVTKTASTGSATVTVTAAGPNHLAFGQQPTNAVAGSAISPSITVQLLDLYNNLVSSNSAATVSVALHSNPGNGTLSGTASVTVKNGLATFSNLAINKAGNGYTLQASSGNFSGITSAAFNISPGKASKLAFSQQPSTMPAGTVITPAVIVQVLDADGNLVTADNKDAITIALGMNPAGGSLSGTLTVSAQGGVATFSDLVISEPGNAYTLAASCSGLAGATSTAFSVSPASSSTVIVSSVNPAVFGQLVTFTATVSGAGTPTGTVQFQIDGTDFDSPVPISGGVAVSPAVSDLSVNTHTVQAIYSGDTTFLSSSGTLSETINPGSPSVLIVSGFPSPSTAGAPGTFTVTVQDAYGNTVTGYNGTIHFSSSDSLASLPADYTFTAADNGVHAFTAVLATVGNQSLTATDTQNGNITGTESAIAVTAAAPDHFLVVPSVAASVAGMPFDVTVIVQDAFNNTVTGYTGTVSFSSADPYGATLPAAYTFTMADNGEHTFSAAATLYTAGQWDVTATDSVTGISGSANVSVTPAAAVGFSILAPATVTADTPFDVAVVALDPYGNVASNYQGTMAFATTDPDPGVALPASYTFTTSDAGMHTFAGGVLLVTPGDQSISVTDTNGLTGSITLTVMSPMPPGGGGAGAAGRSQPAWPCLETSSPTLRGDVGYLLDGGPLGWDLVPKTAPHRDSPGSRAGGFRRIPPGIEQAIDELFANARPAPCAIGGSEPPA
jgi:hypothetical protein